MTEQEILDRIYSSDVDGITLLVNTYSNTIYKIVYDILCDVAEKDIEECVADSFVAFYNNIDDVDLARGSITGYLGVIARRRAINLYHTVCGDDSESFDEYTVEEMSDMLEGEDAIEYAGLSDVILRLCLSEIAPEAIVNQFENEPEKETAEEFTPETEDSYEETEEEVDTEIIVKNSGPFGRVLKTLVAMVGLVAFIVVGVIAFDRLSVPKYEPTTTTTEPTTQAEPFNPLLSAIKAGNEKLIEELITNSLLITDEVLKFAIESADKISYDSIRHIAEEVKKKYGSTGLDPILEGAIFGDFESVEEKLKNKDESEMTPAEKLAVFFAETIGAQLG
jgi:RNA polymerase sigma-70 factor (ECF subfamily)